MEYLGGGSCLDLAKVAPFGEAHVAVVCRELLLGLDYLHASGKIHRDIKAANILLSQTGKVKIADFGVAAQLTNIKSQRMTFVGTPFWMAPEVIQEEGYDFRADIWSLGITAMELINGEPPNAELHPMKALFHIPKAPPPRLDTNKFSRDFKGFVAACLVKDPDYRPTARDLLQHRFIQRAGSVVLLRDLVESTKHKQASQAESTKPKYYEESLKDMSRSNEDEAWVFDTVRPTINTAAPPAPTLKKRKLSETLHSSVEPPTDQLMRMDLNDQRSPKQAPNPPPETVRNIQRRQSAVALTARRMSSPLKHSGSPSPRKISNPKGPSSSRRQSFISSKQPLAIDTSFGNSTASPRPFRRVSHESPHILGSSAPPDPVSNENTPPPVDAVSKEARMGRQIFSKVIDPAFQELHASTAPSEKQDLLARVGQAWSALDALDPDGEYLFFRGILERLQSDSKLSNLIRPFQASLLTPSSTPSTPQRSPSKASSKASPEKRTRDATPQRSPSKRPSKGAPMPKPSTPQRSPSKLVIAQSNPHLQSHARRRQSNQVSLVSAAAEKPQLPGRRITVDMDGEETDPAVEHTRQLADALYSRYGDAIRNRGSHA